MYTIKEIDEQFRMLHSEHVQEYEAELKDWIEQQNRREERSQGLETEMEDILRNSRIDVKRLDELEQRDAEELEHYLAEIRPALVDRPVGFQLSFKQSSIYSAVAGEAGSISVEPYAGSVLAPDTRLIEGIDGDSGNPWVIRYDPKTIDIKHWDKGSGWGCQASGIPFPTYANVWFSFLPSKTAWWEFNAFLAFHGFYIRKANDKWYNCKHTYVKAKVFMRVYQYHWHPTKSFTIIDEHDQNIDAYNFYDQLEKFTYTAPLKAGDLVWVHVQIGLRTNARGGGSYAEVNFSDGKANGIGPAVLLART